MKQKFAYSPFTNLARLLRASLAAWAVTHGIEAAALDLLDGKAQLHGFFSQGAVFTTNNNFLGNTKDHVGLDFREIGLNFSIQPNTRLRLSAQGVSRWAGKMDQGQPWLDYAFADLNLFSDENKRFGIRGGRIKNAHGLYTESRDAAFTRPGVVLPQTIYFERSRKFILSGDGVHFYGEIEAPGGNLDLRLMLVDLPINDISSKSAIIGYKAQGQLEQDRMTPGARLIYETNNKRWRVGMTYFTLSQTYHPVAHDRYLGMRVLLEPWVFSLQYSGEKLTLTTEYSERYTEFTPQAAGTHTQKTTAQNWYAQAQYRFIHDWELLLRYESTTADINDPDGRHYEQATKRPAFTRFTHDFVAGLRYDLTPSIMLRAEYHHVQGTSWLSSLDNPDSSKLQRDWDMFMLLGSYHF